MESKVQRQFAVIFSVIKFPFKEDFPFIMIYLFSLLLTNWKISIFSKLLFQTLWNMHPNANIHKSIFKRDQR